MSAWPVTGRQALEDERLEHRMKLLNLAICAVTALTLSAAGPVRAAAQD